MPIPSYPENRREEYLNNIATGSGEIPPYPENREEQYLDAIAKNGGGGSSDGVLVVHDVEGTFDKTWQEIHDAILSGGALLLQIEAYEDDVGKSEEISLVSLICKSEEFYDNPEYNVYTIYDPQGKEYTCSTADGYPATGSPIDNQEI